MNTKFEEFYNKLLGEQRWSRLREALINQNSQQKVGLALKSVDNKQVKFSSGELQCLEEYSQDSSYSLDLASVLAASSLQWKAKDKVLDLCSAPGGKSLVSQFILNGDGEWHLNELSQSRLIRLKAVMRDFSPALDSQRFFYKRDASKWGLMEKDAYDKVICDVPCSGEAHLLETPSELKRWTAKSSKNLTVRQHAILCAAVDAVKPGGEILYSTCSVNPNENDAVIEKLLKKRSHLVEVADLELSFKTEPTRYGHNLFPDQFPMGPIYFSVLRANPKMCQ